MKPLTFSYLPIYNLYVFIQTFEYVFGQREHRIEFLTLEVSHWGRALRMTCWNGPFWMAKFFRGNCTPSTVFISIPWFNGSQIGTWIEYENDSKSFEWFMISFFLFKMIDSISIYLYIFLSFLIIKEKEKENRIFTFFFFWIKRLMRVFSEIELKSDPALIYSTIAGLDLDQLGSIDASILSRVGLKLWREGLKRVLIQSNPDCKPIIICWVEIGWNDFLHLFGFFLSSPFSLQIFSRWFGVGSTLESVELAGNKRGRNT